MEKTISLFAKTIALVFVPVFIISEAYNRTNSGWALIIAFVLAVVSIALSTFLFQKYEGIDFFKKNTLMILFFIDGVHFTHLFHKEAYAPWYLLFSCLIITGICFGTEFSDQYEKLDKIARRKRLYLYLTIFVIGIISALLAEYYDAHFLLKRQS